MIKQNEFQAYRKKNKTKSSHCQRYHAKLTVLALLLLLLSPLQTQAIDSTQKLRGKENDLGNLSSESISDSVIHVPVESDNIGLSTGEEESPHLFHIPHESSMLDEAQVQEAESIDTKSSNVLKNNFFEQAKMASDQSLSMTLTSDTASLNGENCAWNEQCISGYCSPSLSKCYNKGEDPSPTGKPNGEDCVYDDDCESGNCSSASSTCDSKLPNGEGCEWNSECMSGSCSIYHICGNKLPNGEGCQSDSACESGECSYPGTCTDPNKRSCFSSKTLVTHSERGLIPISEIEVGDYVLDSKFDGSFSRVFALEQNHYGESAFYQLLSSTGTLLELTDRHMVYLKNKALPVPARDIQVGNVLKSNDRENNNDMKVVEIKIIHRDGYYNPVTESGRIVLNDGVVASSFSVAKSSSSNFFDGSTKLIHWHTLSQLANAPLRFVCKAASFSLCSDKKYLNEEGLHKSIVLLKTLSNLPNWQKLIVFPIIFGMGVILTLLELFYDRGEAFYKTVTSSAQAAAQDEGSLGFIITFSLTLAALVPSIIRVWRKKYHLS